MHSNHHLFVTLMVQATMIFSSILAYSQGAKDNPSTLAPSSNLPRFPDGWTLTDVTGRQLKVAILDVSKNSVKVRRKSDGEEVSIPLDKLSEKDRRFVASLGTQKEPIKQVFATALVGANVSDEAVEYMKQNGISVTFASAEAKPDYPDKKLVSLDKFHAGNYDIVWLDLGDRDIIDREQQEANDSDKVVMVPIGAKMTKGRYLARRWPRNGSPAPFVITSDNFVFFNDETVDKVKRESFNDLEIVKKAIDEAIKLVQVRKEKAKARRR